MLHHDSVLPQYAPQNRFNQQMNAYNKARASTDAKLEDLDKQIDEVVTQLRDKTAKIFKQQEELEARQQTLLENNRGTTASPNDKLKLNVGGAEVTVLRETLTQIPGSRLEALFSGRWESQLIRDDEGRIFLDVNPYCFRKILNYLRLLKISKDPENAPPRLPEVSDEHKDSFNRLLDFFGLIPNTGSLSMTSDTNDDSVQDTNDEAFTVSDEGSTEANEANGNGSYRQHSKASGIISIEDVEKCYHALLTSIKDEERALHLAESKLQMLEEKAASEESYVSFFTKSDPNDAVVNIEMDGARVSVKRSTVCLCKESRLAKMFEKNINVDLGNTVIAYDNFDDDDDDDGDCDLFIDQPACMFLMVIDQLRMRAMSDEGDVIPSPYMKCREDMDDLRRIVSYYFEDNEDFILPAKQNQWDTNIISDNQEENILSWLKDAEKSCQPELLYRASRDGWKGSDFHEKCDGKGSTVTLIKSSGGYIFGGYLGSAWHSKDDWISCSDAFLFTLHCHAGLPPTKMSVKESTSCAAYGKSSGLPIFGGSKGFDIYMTENANLNSYSCTNFGDSYNCPPGYIFGGNGKEFLTGSYYFQADEVEVFLIT